MEAKINLSLSPQYLESLQKRFQQFIKTDVEKFFIFSRETLELLSIIDEEDVSVKKIAEIIERDKSFCLKLLRFANSPVFGFPKKVSSIEQALMLLGTQIIKVLILIIPVLENSKKKAPYLEDHFLRVGIGSRVIAEMGGLKNISEIVTAGILHDFGKVIIAEFFLRKEHFENDFERTKILKYLYFCQAEETNLRDVLQDVLHKEIAILGTSHVEIGEKFARMWHFPEDLIEVISLHHDLEAIKKNKKNKEKLHCIYLANFFSCFDSTKKFEKRYWKSFLEKRGDALVNSFGFSFKEIKELIERINMNL